MANNSRSKSEKSNQQNDAAAGQRRAFMRKAAAVGLPVVLATVQPRTAWANGQTQSTAGSANPSGPQGPGGGRGRGNGGPGWTRPGGWDRD